MHPDGAIWISLDGRRFGRLRFLTHSELQKGLLRFRGQMPDYVEQRVPVAFRTSLTHSSGTPNAISSNLRRLIEQARARAARRALA